MAIIDKPCSENHAVKRKMMEIYKCECCGKLFIDYAEDVEHKASSITKESHSSNLKVGDNVIDIKDKNIGVGKIDHLFDPKNRIFEVIWSDGKTSMASETSLVKVK